MDAEQTRTLLLLRFRSILLSLPRGMYYPQDTENLPKIKRTTLDWDE